MRLAISTMRAIGVAALACVIAATTACSAVMAARQPDKKNLEVLDKGTPRHAVVSELGYPTRSVEDKEAKHCHESYMFEQGYSTPTRAGRAVFHATADVFTFFLWELVAIPTELYFDGTEVQLEVLYDENDLVDSVCVFVGAEELEDVDSVVSPEELDRRLHPAPESEPVRESEPATESESADGQ